MSRRQLSNVRFFPYQPKARLTDSFAASTDGSDPVGLYFGTTCGQLWSSRDEGRQWARIAEHLPEIYAVETGQLG